MLALASCSGAGSGSADSIDTLDLKGEIIIPYDSLTQPGKIFATDSRVYLLNSMNADSLVDEYTTDGHFVRSFLSKGQGPNEVPFLYNASMDPYHKALNIVKNPNHLETLNLEGEPVMTNVFAFEVPEGTDNNNLDPNKPMIGTRKALLADGSVLAGNMSRGGLLALYGPDGSFRQFAAPYPSKSDYGEGVPDYLVYNFMQPVIAVSPDGRHFAACMGVADYLVFGELTGDSITVTGSCVAPPQGIKVVVGNGWSSFEYEDSYIIPVKAGPEMSADRVYVVHNTLLENDYLKRLKSMSEGEIPAEAVITEYDLEGNPVAALRIDVVPMGMAVSPDGKAIYVLGETADDGIFVKRYLR